MSDEKQINWERETIKELLNAGIKEKRAQRRWGIFFKLAFLAYMIVVAYMSVSAVKDWRDFKSAPFVAVVNVTGPLMSNLSSNADDINDLLTQAFEHEFSKAVILKINSPGGSPVQANRIFLNLERLKKQHPEKKLYAVIEDLGASGAYWIACAAEQIYADQASIVGSIGVITQGFGFVDAMQKLGVERRVYTAGNNKDFLDPFLPAKPEQEKTLTQRLDKLHQIFIALVKQSRKDKLKGDESVIFSGEFWLGQESVDLGLIDGLADVKYVAKEIVGIEDTLDYEVKQPIFSRFATSLGHSFQSLLANMFYS